MSKEPITVDLFITRTIEGVLLEDIPVEVEVEINHLSDGSVDDGDEYDVTAVYRETVPGSFKDGDLVELEENEVRDAFEKALQYV